MTGIFVHRNRNRVASFVLSAACAVLATGCLTEDDEGSGSVTLQTEIEVLTTTSPTDSTPGIIVTHEVEYECWYDELETDEYDDTTYYAIENSSLLLWSAGDCQAMKLSGSSATVAGTWTTSNLFRTDSVPAAYRDPDCEGDDELEGGLGEEFAAVFENLTVSYTITETSIAGAVSGTFCYGPLLALVYEESEVYDVVSSGCNEVRIHHNLTDKNATYTFGFEGDSITTTFSHAGTKCSMSVSMGTGNEPPQCAEEYAAELAFDACIEESGFYPDFAALNPTTMTEKRAVSESSPAAAVREALRKAAARLP